MVPRGDAVVDVRGGIGRSGVDNGVMLVVGGTPDVEAGFVRGFVSPIDGDVGRIAGDDEVAWPDGQGTEGDAEGLDGGGDAAQAVVGDDLENIPAGDKARNDAGFSSIVSIVGVEGGGSRPVGGG